MSGVERQSQEGTPFSGTVRNRAGDAGLAEVLLGQHVRGDLAPELGYDDAFTLKDHLAVGLDDARGALDEANAVVGACVLLREAPFDLHSDSLIPYSCLEKTTTYGG